MALTFADLPVERLDMFGRRRPTTQGHGGEKHAVQWASDYQGLPHSQQPPRAVSAPRRPVPRLNLDSVRDAPNDRAQPPASDPDTSTCPLESQTQDFAVSRESSNRPKFEREPSGAEVWRRPATRPTSASTSQGTARDTRVSSATTTVSTLEQRHQEAATAAPEYVEPGKLVFEGQKIITRSSFDNVIGPFQQTERFDNLDLMMSAPPRPARPE